jgi:hypothetical protein
MTKTAIRSPAGREGALNADRELRRATDLYEPLSIRVVIDDRS